MKNLKKGKMIFQSIDDSPVTKWKNKRDVCVIKNAYVLAFAEVVNKQGKAKLKPSVVQTYNERMSRIFCSDQILSCCSTIIRSNGIKNCAFTSWKFFSVMLTIFSC